tara:strand:- start:44597 stop:44830 length:234 start_codon:yes stop_codon:yes gene_type:complete
MDEPKPVDKNTYVQCKLKKGDTYKTAWIPKKYSIIGKFIKILDDDGWEVIEQYSTLDGETVNNNSRDYKNHRKATDV